MKKIANYIVYGAIILALVAVIGFVAVFTRGGTTDFKTFYAKYDGEMILGDTQKALPANKELTFEVKYTFDNVVKSETKDFFVSVVPNVTEETDFACSVDGESVSYSELSDTDFSKCFALVKTESGFTMNIPYAIDMQSCLSAVHTGKTVIVDDSVDITKTPYFAIKLTSYNEKSTIRIPFTVEKDVSNIVLIPDGELIY